ncbi:MAG TPA: Maf family protein [Devosia sp.]
MLILASTSATRKALLSGAGLHFESSPAPIDERAEEAAMLGKGPAAVARHLAEAKALAVSRLQPDRIVVGADQTLSLGDEIFHKPADLETARQQLGRLRGRTHRLSCGVALARQGAILWSDVAVADLTMRAFSDMERDAILAEEGPLALGSVGGYRLEGPSVRLFERVEGDYFTVLGLPLLPLLAALRRHAPHELKGFT